MVAAARRWLATEGAPAARRQPMSGVPVKVFAFEAGSLGIPLVPFLTWAVGARSIRFALATGAATLAHGRLPRTVTEHPTLLLTAWTLVFALGLWRTVAAWSDR